MAKFTIKKSADKITVIVTLPPLPPIGREAVLVQEVVFHHHVISRLAEKNIEVGELLSGPIRVSNLSGPGSTGTFIFSAPQKKTPAPKKDLTEESKPVILPEKPKKRKRVKRDSQTGTDSTS